MKILVVCQYYRPENFQINDICEQLAADGNEITVITGLPNYPTGVVPDAYRHGGKRNEIVQGVHVIRCREVVRKKGAVGLARNYLSFCLSATRRVRKIQDAFDLVFVYQLSPVFMAIPGIRFARKHKIPLLLYCCDLWPESMKMLIKNERSFAFQAVKRISRAIYSSCDKILVQSNSFIPYMQRVHDIPPDRLTYLPAYASDGYLTIAPGAGDSATTNFVFLGNIGIAQNVEGILDAVGKLRDLPDFLVHIVGDGSSLQHVKQKAAAMGISDAVIFHGRRPAEEMPSFYQLADACLVSLNADNLTGLTLPSKVQGYMAAGKPIIGMIDGSTMEVIRDSRCGICVSAGDTDGLASAMRDFIVNRDSYAACGQNGRDYFIAHFSKKVFMDGLYCELNEVRRKENVIVSR